MNLNGVIYGDSQFVAVGGAPRRNGAPAAPLILTSIDAVSWTPVDPGISDTYLNAITFGNGLFVAVGWNGAITTSPNGHVWTQRDSGMIPIPGPGLTTLTSVAYGDGIFVALGPDYEGNGGESVTSTDGLTWTRDSTPKFCRTISFGNHTFVAAGGATFLDPQSRSYLGHAVIWTSPDGINWTKMFEKISASGTEFFAETFGGGQFAVTGGVLDQGFKQLLFSSAGGENWVGHEMPAGVTVLGFGNGHFVGVGSGKSMRSAEIARLVGGFTASGQFQGTIPGLPGHRYSINMSSDLRNWTVLTNVTAGTTGTAEFTYPIGVRTPKRYFRASIEP